MHRVRAGSGDVVVTANGDAFAGFYAGEVAAALRLAWLLTHDHDVSRDVVQDAFTAMFERFDQIDRPLPYLRRSIVNGVRQRARTGEREVARMRTVAVTSLASVAGPTGGVIDAVGSLPPRQRTVVVLRYWAQLNDTEIADAMSCPAGTVRSLASRAISRLRNELA